MMYRRASGANVAGAAVGLGFSAWILSYAAPAHAAWFVRQGLSPEEATRRTMRYVQSSYLWGMGYFWVMPVGWLFLWLGAGFLPFTVMRFWWRLPYTTMPPNNPYLGPAVYETAPPDAVLKFTPLFAVASLLLGALIIYGYYLLAAHLWRRQVRDIYRVAPWWKLARKPLVFTDQGLAPRNSADRRKLSVGRFMVVSVTITPWIVAAYLFLSVTLSMVQGAVR